MFSPHRNMQGNARHSHLHQNELSMKTTFLLNIAITAFLLSSETNAQSNFLDPTFGNNGIVDTDINENNDVARSVILQPDGKIVVGGYTSNGIKDLFCLVRYLPDGSLDMGFGSNGKVLSAFTSTSVGSVLALQEDGKILLSGHAWSGSENQFAMMRYLSNGSPDSTFGVHGQVQAGFTMKNAISRAMTIQPDGKIILAGNTYSETSDFDNFSLIRFLTDGSIDNNFGSSGKVEIGIGEFTRDWINSIALEPSGKIIAAGYSQDQFALVRLHIDGSLDASFGNSGIVTTSFGGATNSLINDVVVQADGKIVAAGRVIDGTGQHGMARYESDGSLDPTFATNGKFSSFLGEDKAGGASILVQSDGKLLVGGSFLKDSIFQYYVVRHQTDGEIDESFGNEGLIYTKVDEDFSHLEAIEVQSDGGLIATGYSGSFPYNFTTVRYNALFLGNEDFQIRNNEVLIYPNPANEEINIKYELSKAGSTKISLFSVDGRLIESVLNKQENSGKQHKKVNVTKLPAGVYFIELIDARGMRLTKKLLVK